VDDLEFDFIGWCNTTERSGAKHDKVWTAFKAGSTYYAGWGARGKKISFKNHGQGWSGEQSLKDVMRKKEAPKGEYKEVDTFQLFAIFPTFKEDVEKWLMFDSLTNKVR
jgi:hypothetical protein